MKMETCSVRTMDGRLIDVGLVLRSLRLHRKVLKLVLFDLPERVLLGSPLWYPKVCYLFGQMKMGGKELTQPSLPCKFHY